MTHLTTWLVTPETHDENRWMDMITLYLILML